MCDKVSFSKMNETGVKFVCENIIHNQKFTSGSTCGHSVRVLDVGCGDAPYKNAISEEFRDKVEFVLLDPNVMGDGVVNKHFDEYCNEFCGNEKFDLIILGCVIHELYLRWCQVRIWGAEERGVNNVLYEKVSSEEGLNAFLDNLFNECKKLLKDGGYVLMIENYHPQRLGLDSLLAARAYQLEKMNHADTPAAFVHTWDYLDWAVNHGFEKIIQNSTRCVSPSFYNNLTDEGTKGVFERRRFDIALLRSRGTFSTGDSMGDPIGTRRGTLADTSKNIKMEEELGGALRLWAHEKMLDDEIKRKYREIFWETQSGGNQPVFQELVNKSFGIVKADSSYSFIREPKLFSCWVSIASRITKGRFCAVDRDGQIVPLVLGKNGGRTPEVQVDCQKDWNKIAFNSFSSNRAVKSLFGKTSVSKNVSAPSVYAFLNKHSEIRTLTLTYARREVQKAGSVDHDVELSNQEDAISALDLQVWKATDRTDGTRKEHGVIVLDLPFDANDATGCVDVARNVQKLMVNEYFKDEEAGRDVETIAAIYLDFLFLRRFEQNSSPFLIADQVNRFIQRWTTFIDGSRSLTCKNQLKERLKEAELRFKAVESEFSIDDLPCAFITLSAPEYFGRDEDPPGSIMIFSDKVMPRDLLLSMMSVAEKTFAVIRSLELKWLNERRELELKRANLKSALGSIMSRNGSHNIGSHVLSALSHNVGTMSDDRVLYQYIQHRMDYIAAVTTDFPQWTIPTLFVGGLMKNFYSQKHLLDYISRSEGLRAYKFQERNLDDVARKNQQGTIRIFIRKVFSCKSDQTQLPSGKCYSYPDPDGKKRTIHYFFAETSTMFRELPSTGGGSVRRCAHEVSESGGSVCFLESDEKSETEWEQDVRVAIPGGVIGQHAFYTILENVIRNTAKHGWSSAQNLQEKDLEINVDFEEYVDFVEFTISDNVSDIYGGAKELKKFWKGFWEEFKDWTTARKTLEALEAKGGPKFRKVAGWLKFNESDDGFESKFLRACLKPLNDRDAALLEAYLREGKGGKRLPIFYRIVAAYLKKYPCNLPQVKNGLIIPLHHDLHRKLAQAFIDKSGENWGLAEMKISAGYLAQRKIEEIGGLDEKGNDILIPVAVPGVCRNVQNCSNCISCSTEDFKKRPCHEADENCPVKSHRFHLGYQFKIGKPKEILIVVNELTLNGWADKLLTKFDDLWKKGIHLAVSIGTGKDEIYKRYTAKSKCSSLTAFNYRYVVFVDGGGKMPKPEFCFRQVGGLTDREAFLKLVAGGNVDGLRQMVFSTWLKSLKDARGFREDERIALTLNVRGTDVGSERGLVTAQDLMETMFKECYHTALIAFIADPPVSVELSDTTKHLIMLLSLIKVEPETLQRVPENVDCTSGVGIKEYIRGQLSAYCDLLKTRLFLSSEFLDALKSISQYSHGMAEEDRGEQEVLRNIEKIGRSFEAAIARRLFRAKNEESDFVKRGCEALTHFLINTEKEKLDNWLDAFRGRCDVFNRFPDEVSSRRGNESVVFGFGRTIKAVLDACAVPEEAEFEALVESLNSMFLASDVYLRKYEERIATLPVAYKHDDSKVKVGSEKALQEKVDELINGGRNTDQAPTRIVKYSRHDWSKPEKAIYTEALSGSQSYLNSLSRMMSNLDGAEVPAQITRLLENALLRVLIIDERVANFLKAHEDNRMIETFSNMGISVAEIDENAPPRIEGSEANVLYPVKHYRYENDTKKVLELEEVFDILIIHQGIIDKWWEEEKHSSVGVKRILDNIRKNGGPQRVVITTGRGRSDNIPSTEKVLPFSSVESALFRRYPEKVILVNTVLNLLPYTDEKDKPNT